MNKPFTVNALGRDGGSYYAVYFMTDTIEEAEEIVLQLDLIIDEAGVCEMVSVEGEH